MNFGNGRGLFLKPNEHCEIVILAMSGMLLTGMFIHHLD